jgi:starch synthase
MAALSIWHVTREYAGLAEAGGVKDAVRGLASALARAGVGSAVVLPLYGFADGRLRHRAPICSFSLPVPDQDKGFRMKEEPVKVYPLERDGVRFFLVDSPRFNNKRDVYTYTPEDEAENPHKRKGTGHWDFHQMNLVLQRAALETALSLGERSMVFHCHDGHAAFLPAIMREDHRFAERLGSSAAVVTIHNAGIGYHQEIWNVEFARLVSGLPEAVLSRGLLDGSVDPLLLAGDYAVLSTVSEQYAKELLSEKGSEVSGGLGRMLRERGIPLNGITNGVDAEPFDPRHPDRAGLPFRFDPSEGDWEGKKKCRRRLFELLAPPGAAADESLPLFTFIGRLTPQKGIDVLCGAISTLLSAGGGPGFVILGQGEAAAEERFRALAAAKPGRGRLFFIPRYDPQLAKLIYAAGDFFLIPSAFEPCGLTDYYAQLMGTIPLVHHVGGLVKVRDGETGFSYREQSASALAQAIERCLRISREDPALLERIRKTAFSEIFRVRTWDTVARQGYVPLYESALSRMVRGN